jgi:hypothetical protein
MLFTCVPPGWAQQNSPSEYQLKAAFLFNFAKFIDWPSGSFATPQSPFLICILGADPFGDAIDQLLQGKTLAGRAVMIQRTGELSQVRHCQVVFVSVSEGRHLPEILGALRGSNMLLVGDSEGFAGAGGTIQFILEDNRVRFLINTDAAQQAGLTISSKLLALAIIVRGAQTTGGS